MSESAARVRQPIDLDEFERRLRGPAPVARAGEDPLAELARLVGSNPPFGVPRPTAEEQAELQAQSAPSPDPERSYQPEQAYAAEPVYAPGPTYADEALRPSFDERAQVDGDYHPDVAQPAVQQQTRFEPQIDFGRFEEELRREEAGQPAFVVPEPRMAAPRQSDFGVYEPRHEASRDDEGYAPEPAYLADEIEPRSSRRKYYLMGAGLAVVLGAVGIATVLKGGPKTSGDAPTILAASGPVKVAPANPGGAELPSQTSSVLDKGKVDRVNQSRVVTREEQPIDILRPPPAPARPVAPASADQTGTAAPNGNGLFPEPKRVKTVSVRPDGSVISGDAAAEAPRAPTPPQRATITSMPPNVGAPAKPAALASQAPAPKSAAAAPAATPAAPKATTRVAPPKVETAALSDAKPAAPRPAPTTTPVASAGGAGGYAVQLAAPGSEAEARDVSGRMQKKYAGELGSYHPSIVKASVGDKQIYRVRVSGLSKDAATLSTAPIVSGHVRPAAKN